MDGTAMILVEKHVCEGLQQAEAQPVVRPMQTAADCCVAADIARQGRAQSRRRVPLSLDSQVIEVGHQLRGQGRPV